MNIICQRNRWSLKSLIYYNILYFHQLVKGSEEEGNFYFQKSAESKSGDIDEQMNMSKFYYLYKVIQSQECFS